MALKLISGKKTRAKRLVVAGVEGIGKTTFASKAPDPVFIDLENGSDFMDVTRTETPTTWKMLLEQVDEIAADPNICKTIVIDTGDKAEQLCITHICEKYKKAGIEEFGYGKGYTYLKEEFQSLLDKLDKCIDAGINVIVTAHTALKKFEQPDEMGAYDRYELKMSKQVSPLVKEWTDILLFCNYKTYVNKGEGLDKNKVSGGKRVMYATHHPCWDAKNRHGLPDEMDFDFANIAHLFKDTREAVRELAQRDGIDLADVCALAAKQGHIEANTSFDDMPDKIVEKWALRYWPQIVEAISNNKTTKEEEENG